MRFIESLKKIIPSGIKTFIKRKIEIFKIYKARKYHKKEVARLKKKDKIKVAFFVFNEAIWKYGDLYFLFKENPKYDPVVFICPFITYGEEIMAKEMESSYISFKERGYRTIKTQNEKGEFIDVKNTFKPDLAFFCTPWPHTLKKYSIGNYLDTLSCYVSYAFMTTYVPLIHFNRPVHYLTWRFFIETHTHKKLAKKFSLGKGKNIIVSGYPGLDFLLDKDYQPKNVWKVQEKVKKKIIWAPHHTIPEVEHHLYMSTFTLYCSFMLEIAQKYKDVLQFAFKPHPNLKGKLNQLWGIQKTTSYYKKWQDISNGQLEEGGYLDLFKTSDAMIHDSGSFIIEYLYTEKPVMYLLESEKSKEKYNDIGLKAIEVAYNGYSETDIINFIEEQILKGIDRKKEERLSFLESVIKPPNGKSASENIFNHINTTLNITN